MYKLIQWDPHSQSYVNVKDRDGFPVCSFSHKDMFSALRNHPFAYVYDCEANSILEDEIPASTVRRKVPA